MSAFGKIVSWLQLLSLPHIQGSETLEKLSRSREGTSLSGLRLVGVGMKSVLMLLRLPCESGCLGRGWEVTPKTTDSVPYFSIKAI